MSIEWTLIGSQLSLYWEPVVATESESEVTGYQVSEKRRQGGASGMPGSKSAPPPAAVIRTTEAQRGEHAHDGQLDGGADAPRGGGGLHHPHPDAQRRRARPRVRTHPGPPTK